MFAIAETDQPIPMPAGSSFAALLRRGRLRAGHSKNSLGHLAGINPSYVQRMESGERDAPTREVALALARGMGLSPGEIDSLLFAAGHVPPSLQKLGAQDSTVAALVQTLTNDRLSPESRADLRACVEAMCARWAGNAAPVAVPAVGKGSRR